MTKEEIVALIKKADVIQSSIDFLFDNIAPIQKQIAALRNEQQSILEQIGTLTVENIESKIDYFAPITDEEIELIMVGETNNMQMYRLAQKITNTKLKGFHRDGYYPETDQTAFSISLHKGNSEHTQMVYNHIMRLLPFIKERVNSGSGAPKTPRKMFKIFEHTCSASGICGLELDITTNNWIITKIVYSRYNVIGTYSTLMDALKYIEQNIWYQSDNKDDYREDDDDY